MVVQIDLHTLERAEEHGTTEEEIKDVINTGFALPARAGRLGKARAYDFKQKRHGKFYEQKRVEAIYTVEKDVIATVTVYVFYGKWMKKLPTMLRNYLLRSKKNCSIPFAIC